MQSAGLIWRVTVFGWLGLSVREEGDAAKRIGRREALPEGTEPSEADAGLDGLPAAEPSGPAPPPEETLEDPVFVPLPDREAVLWLSLIHI